MSEEEWIPCWSDKRKPEPGVKVLLKGSDYGGEWIMRGFYKPYKPTSRRNVPGRFFCLATLEPLLGNDKPEFWRPA